MDYQIEEIDISSNLDKLDLDLPNVLSFYPENLELVNTKNDLIFTDAAVEVGKYFREQNIPTVFLGCDTELYRSRKSADIYLPAIFFSLSLISQNPSIVSVALNVLSNYVTDFLKGHFGKKTAHIEFIIETKEKGKVKKISYKGDVEGIRALENLINSIK